MKRFYIPLIFILLCGTASAATTPIYTENFDGAELNNSMWTQFKTATADYNISVGSGVCTIGAISTSVQGIQTDYPANWVRVFVADREGDSQEASRYMKFAVSTDESTGFTVSGDVLTPVTGFLLLGEGNVLKLREYSSGVEIGSEVVSDSRTDSWGAETIDMFVNDSGFYAILNYGQATERIVSKTGTFDNITKFAFGQGCYSTYDFRAVDLDKIEFYSEYVQPAPPPTITYTPADNTVSTNHYNTQNFIFSSTQPINYTYLLNGTAIKAGTGTSATYSNVSNAVGDYNLTLTTYNENMTAGNITKTWAWTVNELPTVQPVPTYSPVGTTVSQYENLGYDFTLTCSNTLANFTWTLDGAPVSSTDTQITSSYTLPAQSAGAYNLSVNVSNDAGYDVHSWAVTYIENSMTVDPLFFNQTASNGTAFIFNVSNFTDGITDNGWSPQNFNSTYAGQKYSWIYNNGTIIDTQTASSDSEALDFTISDVPEGIYKIGTPGNANFSSVVTATNSQVTATFTGSSNASGVSYAWDFENDGTIDSTEQNPVHVYPTIGLYTVNLTVSNEYGSDTELKTDHISVAEAFVIDTIAKWYWFFRSLKFWLILPAVI